MDYNPVCGVDGQTYGNKCGANCAGIEIAHIGECKTAPCACTKEYAPVCAKTYAYEETEKPSTDSTTTNTNTNTLVARPPMKEVIKTYGNKCMAKCENAQILYEGECKTTPEPQSDFYKAAYWTCTNGKEFKETSEKCLPYAEWKNIARTTCEKMSTKCAQPATAGAVGGGTNAQDTNTVDSNEQASPMPPLIDTKCIGGTVTLADFEVKEQCEVGCKTYVDEQGCKVKDCGARGIERVCKPVFCTEQPIEDIKNLKDNCYKNNGKIVINTETGCSKYVCLNPNDTNSTQQYCKKIEDLSDNEERCKTNGGEFLTKTNEFGCITIAECVREKKTTEAGATLINKAVLSDKGKLLELALKLESLRIDLKTTAQKVKAIANYYREQNDTESAAKFDNAATLLETAVTKVDSIKQGIKNKVDNFSEEDAVMVKEGIQEIRESILKEVILAILG